jgi:hypothetical protein
MSMLAPLSLQRTYYVPFAENNTAVSSYVTAKANEKKAALTASISRSLRSGGGKDRKKSCQITGTIFKYLLCLTY